MEDLPKQEQVEAYIIHLNVLKYIFGERLILKFRMSFKSILFPFPFILKIQGNLPAHHFTIKSKQAILKWGCN